MEKVGLDRLSELREIYEDEKQKREKLYSGLVKNAKKEYDRVAKEDYSNEFKEQFETSLNSLERLYSELVDVYSKTKGLSFSVTKYIDSVTPRKIKKSDVFNHFDHLVEECTDALGAINNSRSPEDDILPIKDFCQGLVDLRYIVKNETKLIEETGRAEIEKQQRLAELQKEIDSAKIQYETNTQLEKFDCFEELEKYKKQLVKNAQNLENSMLSERPIQPRNDYQFLLGFQKQEIPEADVKFAKKILGLKESCLATNPIYFDLKVGHTALLINAPSAYFGEFEFDDLIRNIYFSMASNLPAQDLLIAPVEHESVTDAVLSSLENTIRKELNDNKSDDGIYLSTAKKDDQIMEGINEIKSLTNLRSTIYRSNKVKDIFAYNKLDSMTTDFFVLYLVNHYPNGFENTRINGVEELRRMATNNGEKGIITVICQATDAEYSASLPRLTAQELGADVIDVDYSNQKGAVSISYRYNNQPATLDIRAGEKFSEKEYWKNYSKYFNNASTVLLYDILEKFDKKPKLPYYKQISMPIGFCDGKPYEYSMDVCSVQDFGIITGKSGSGKSSFLHTLILSSASRYSPDELRIRLVDFKSEKDSPEFSQYKKVPGKNNLYIPHIDYLLVNGKPECALDLFNMITQIIKERTAIMNQANCAEFSKYMESDKVKNGELPKLPFLLYIIDEYNLMINGNKRSNAVKQQIISKIEDTVKSARAFGIGILFSGQSIADDMDSALAQMDSRIGLMNNSLEDYQALMGKPDRSDSVLDLAFLRGKGYSVFSNDAGKTRKRVRHAFAGNTGCASQLAFTKKIREKYGEYDQVVAGSEDFFGIAEEKQIDEPIEGNGRTQLFVPVGVTSASMVKSCLEFSNSKSGLNYYAFADVNQLYKLEQNAIFGYLNQTANLGYKNATVEFLAENDIIDDCLGEFLSTYPKLKNKFVFKTTYESIAKEIAHLHEVYAERNNTRAKETSDPIFVVVHDVEWLSDKDDSWVAYANRDDGEDDVQSLDNNDEELFEQAKQQIYENKAYARFSEQMKLQLINQIVQKMKAQTAPVVSSRKIEKVDRSGYTADTYVDMFNTLYTRGNRVGIYVLVASENFSPIKKTILNQMDYDEVNKAKGAYSIYGSEKEYEEEQIDKDAIASCVYISTSNAKTRLYDYSIKNNKKFWTKFMDKI